MTQFDAKVLDAFLEQQEKLFPEIVAETREEADDFLAECMAVVVESKQEVWDYFEEEGVDIAGMDELKKEMIKIVDILKNPEEYYKKGIRQIKGIILEGAPGNGKTLSQFAKNS